LKLTDGVDSLAPLALSLISLVIVVVIGSIVLVEMEPATYTSVDVENEQAQPTSPLPTNVTVSGASAADYVQIEKGKVEVVLEDSSASSNITLSESSDYNVYYDSGNVEVQSDPGGVTYDETSDQVYITYSYEETNTGTATIGDGESALDTFSDFFQVLVVVGIAAVIFLLLGGLKRAGNRSMA
jgi:hypothetical protein